MELAPVYEKLITSLDKEQFKGLLKQAKHQGGEALEMLKSQLKDFAAEAEEVAEEAEKELKKTVLVFFTYVLYDYLTVLDKSCQ